MFFEGGYYNANQQKRTDKRTDSKSNGLQNRRGADGGGESRGL